MTDILVLATAGAGGDLPPLMAVTLGLRERGHRVTVLGDRASAALAHDQDIEAIATAPEHDLGPHLVRAVRDAQALPLPEQGQLVHQRLAAWASNAAVPVQHVVAERQPDLLLTSLFGVPIAHAACSPSSTPWAVINSTFYVGPNPPRPIEDDFAPRAVPLFHYLVDQLEPAALVLHATDAHFDYDHVDLPPRHHYVGPLFWELPTPDPGYLDEPGDSWILVTISSQLQDDIPLAQEALGALADHPCRVLLTIGVEHDVAELGPIPSNVWVEHYVSHAAVLRRSILLISHAGHGSVMKALLSGVPMLLLPWGRDQPGVAARAERLGAAVVVERDQVQAPVLTQAIDEALSDSYREAARGASRHLRAEDSVATACASIESLVGQAS